MTKNAKTITSRTRLTLVILLALSAVFPIAGIVENQFGSTPQYYQILIYLILIPSIVLIPVILVSKSSLIAAAGAAMTGIVHLVPPAIALPLGYLPPSIPAILHILVSIILVGAGFWAYQSKPTSTLSDTTGKPVSAPTSRQPTQVAIRRYERLNPLNYLRGSCR